MLDTAPAGVDPDGEGLHEGALLQRHVVRQLVAEVRRVDVVPGQLQCTLAVQCSVSRQNMLRIIVPFQGIKYIINAKFNVVS